MIVVVPCGSVMMVVPGWPCVLLFADGGDVDSAVGRDGERSDFALGGFVENEAFGGRVFVFARVLVGARATRSTRPLGSVPAIKFALASKARTRMWASSLS